MTRKRSNTGRRSDVKATRFQEQAKVKWYDYEEDFKHLPSTRSSGTLLEKAYEIVSKPW